MSTAAWMSDYLLAGRIMAWLEKNKCTVSSAVKDGVISVHYTLQLDLKPQPPITIFHGKITIPKGSQEAVVMAFFDDWKL